MGGGHYGHFGRFLTPYLGGWKGGDGYRARPMLAHPVKRDLDADFAQESRGAAQTV